MPLVNCLFQYIHIQIPLVNVASDKNLLQLQYNTWIEVWQLGVANPPEDGQWASSEFNY